ncbi:MAG TPA: hypothetical protein PKD34_03580, partial [Candidatus Doudnabacteria bacterium]|nr:hypothetical protein [Candidatus Doudnabacteria bacterium]
MSKKKKKKFRPNFSPQRTDTQRTETVVPTTAVATTSSSPISKPLSSGVMTFSDSRQAIANHAAYNSHKAEYDSIN